MTQVDACGPADTELHEADAAARKGLEPPDKTDVLTLAEPGVTASAKQSWQIEPTMKPVNNRALKSELEHDRLRLKRPKA